MTTRTRRLASLLAILFSVSGVPGGWAADPALALEESLWADPALGASRLRVTLSDGRLRVDARTRDSETATALVESVAFLTGGTAVVAVVVDERVAARRPRDADSHHLATIRAELEADAGTAPHVAVLRGAHVRPDGVDLRHIHDPHDRGHRDSERNPRY